MKRFILLIVFSLFVQTSIAQLIEGQVIDKITDQPLMGASIYFDGSSIGTLSDENGYFKLERAGQINAKLITSYVGYGTVTINEQTIEKQLVIALLPKTEQLKEVVLKSDPFSRKQKLEAFRLEFLGESTAASRSSIFNEEDIKLYFNTNEKTLIASSRKPIIVRNRYLGYEIKFDLQDFKIAFKKLSLNRDGNIKYTIIRGFTHFTNMPDNINQKTNDRRASSYLASPTHLMQTLWKNSFNNEKFTFLKDGKKISADSLFKQSPQIELGLKKFHIKKGKLSISYKRKYDYHSTLDVTNDTFFTVDSYGNYQPYQNLIFGRYMGEIRVANMLPTDYMLPIESILRDRDQVVEMGNKSDDAKPKEITDSGVNQKNITICWDTSISMTERDIDKDLSVLEDIFEKSPDVEVQLLLFDINVEEKKYTVTNGDWEGIKQYLLNARYEGAAIYADLIDRIKYSRVYVFTDGNKVFGDDVLLLEKGSIIINSCPNRNVDFLRRTALLGRSRLMDFADILPENMGKTVVENDTNEEQLITGTIYADNKRASNLKIMVKGSSTSTYTDDFGNYSINGNLGDSLLVYSKNGENAKIVPIEQELGTKIFVDSNLFQLDEVVVTEDKKEEKMLVTAHGLKNENEVGYGVVSLSEDKIFPREARLGDAVRNKVAGLNVNIKSHGQGGLGTATIRGVFSIMRKYSALIVIDGMPLERSLDAFGSADIKNYDFIDPANVANITVLKSLAATNKYGNLGAGGAIVITTKTAQFKGKEGEKKDLALIKDNIYNEQGERIESNTSPFLKALRDSESENEAYDTYLMLRAFNGDNIAFYLDAFAYFKKNNKRLASRIISNILVLHPEDVHKLRTVALSFASIGFYENALKINNEIIKLSPNDVQAHLDSALLKEEMGLHQEALNELLALAKNERYPLFNIDGISKTLNREISNLIFRHKSILDVSKVETRFLNNPKFKVRLVFEWNNPEAEFEIQFVSPQKRYFNWEHSNSYDDNRIRDEIAQGFVMEEFELYGDEKGQWIINAKYLGDMVKPSEAPLVLKCTIVKDFGSDIQSKKIVSFHFNALNEKREVALLQLE